MVETLQVLRALHILAAIAWAGGGVYASAVVFNAGRGEAARQLQAGFFATGRHGPFMGVTALLTVLLGGAVMGMGDYGIDAVGRTGAMVLGTSMTLALAALAVGVLGHMPNERRLQPLAQRLLDGGLDGDAAGEYDALVARDHRLGRVSMALIGLAMLGMVTFRMFP